MIRRIFSFCLVRLAALEEGFADAIDIAAPGTIYQDTAAAMHARAARLRTSALELRRTAIKMLLSPAD